MNAAQQRRSRVLVAALSAAGALACALAYAPPAAAKPPAAQGETAAIEAATRSWKSLHADAVRRRERARWLVVLGAFEREALRARTGPTAALAWFRAGRAAEDLAAVSGTAADVRKAERYYLRVAECCADDSRADDALLAAAVLESRRLDDPAAARRSLERAAALRGDRRRDADALLASLPAPPPAARPSPAPARPEVAARPAAEPSTTPPPDALDVATAQLERLRADREKRRLHDRWVAAIESLERAGEALTDRPRSTLAFLRAGRAAEELCRLSARDDDAKTAVRLYRRAAERGEGLSLADDALVSAANLEIHRLGDPAAARVHLEAAVALRGDQAAEAKRLLDRLPAAVEPAAPPDPQAAAVAALSAQPGRPAAPPAAAEPAKPAPVVEARPPAPAPEGPAQGSGPKPDEVRHLRRALAADTEWSVAEQMGLKVRRIVIDAGHGGHDTGAIGPGGAHEKDIALAVARQLASVLAARGYETVLTRDGDEFLSLERRTEIANRERGDLFLSIHCNATRSRRTSGVETYYLNTTSNRYAMRLAARENATTERSVSDLQFLLADLATRANTVDSAKLAAAVQRSLVGRTKVKDLGVKHALFFVLLGARMPAVLVETDFISNPAREKKLLSARYQQSLATAIADGIDRFVARRARMAALDL